MDKYFGSFSDLKNVFDNFRPEEGDILPTEDELLFASYGGEMYEGDAVVIFEKDGKVYEVHGSHCSCNGLEEQWGPAEVTWPALAMRVKEMASDRWGFLGSHENDAQEAFKALVKSRASQG